MPEDTKIEKINLDSLKGIKVEEKRDSKNKIINRVYMARGITKTWNGSTSGMHEVTHANFAERAAYYLKQHPQLVQYTDLSKDGKLTAKGKKILELISSTDLKVLMRLRTIQK